MKRTTLIVKDAVEQKAAEYVEVHGEDQSDAITGFIKKNQLQDSTVEEIDTLLASAKMLQHGDVLGEGDRFKSWCEKLGRDTPTDELVELMNKSLYAPDSIAKALLPDHVPLWRAYCTYQTGRGR